jgi:hypothetical protein
MAAANDVSAPTEVGVPSKKRKLSILDLPSETQKDIFKHVSTARAHN